MSSYCEIWHQGNLLDDKAPVEKIRKQLGKLRYDKHELLSSFKQLKVFCNRFVVNDSFPSVDQLLVLSVDFKTGVIREFCTEDGVFAQIAAKMNINIPPIKLNKKGNPIKKITRCSYIDVSLLDEGGEEIMRIKMRIK